MNRKIRKTMNKEVCLIQLRVSCLQRSSEWRQLTSLTVRGAMPSCSLETMAFKISWTLLVWRVSQMVLRNLRQERSQRMIVKLRKVLLKLATPNLANLNEIVLTCQSNLIWFKVKLRMGQHPQLPGMKMRCSTVSNSASQTMSSQNSLVTTPIAWLSIRWAWRHLSRVPGAGSMTTRWLMSNKGLTCWSTVSERSLIYCASHSK